MGFSIFIFSIVFFFCLDKGNEWIATKFSKIFRSVKFRFFLSRYFFILKVFSMLRLPFQFYKTHLWETKNHLVLSKSNLMKHIARWLETSLMNAVSASKRDASREFRLGLDSPITCLVVYSHLCLIVANRFVFSSLWIYFLATKSHFEALSLTVTIPMTHLA